MPIIQHGSAMRTEIDRRGLGALALGHFCADMAQGALPALLPFLIAAHHWSYGAASALVLAATVASSVIQPLFGHASDGRPLPWLMPVGVLLGGIGIALAGVLGTYAGVFAVVVVSGLGVAAFHPEASRFANVVSGSRQATGMSLFSVGGNAGFAAGPILVTPLVLALGLPGGLFLAVLPAVAALVLARELGRLVEMRAAPRSARAAAPGPDRWGPFARLSAVVAVRTGVYFGLMTFVPLYYASSLGQSKAAGNTALSVMLAAGAIGTLIGGGVGPPPPPPHRPVGAGGGAPPPLGAPPR